MTTDVTGEKTGSHRGDLKENKTSDEAEHQKTWHDDNQPLGRINIHRSACQIVDEQMTHHAHGRCGNDFVELESEKCFQPSPKQKICLVEHHPGNEYRTEETNDRRTDRSIRKNHKNQTRKNAQDNLNCVYRKPRSRFFVIEMDFAPGMDNRRGLPRCGTALA